MLYSHHLIAPLCMLMFVSSLAACGTVQIGIERTPTLSRATQQTDSTTAKPTAYTPTAISSSTPAPTASPTHLQPPASNPVASTAEIVSTAAPAATVLPTLDNRAVPLSSVPNASDPRPLMQQAPPLNGQDVLQVQQRLLALGYRQIEQPNGIFEKRTEAAVRTFQAMNQLVVDGIVGQETRQQLFSADAIPAWMVTPILWEQNHLLGASYGTVWFDALTARYLLRGGEVYRLFNGMTPLGNASGTRPEPAPISLGNRQSTFIVTLTPMPSIRKTIAVGGQWDVYPRPVHVLTDTNSLYRYEMTVREFLKVSGIAQPTLPSLPQVESDDLFVVWLADLEGDGQEEAIINVQLLNRDDLPGSYSCIFIQRDTQLSPVVMTIAPDNYPNFHRHKVEALMDLNGDQTLEIVVENNYYESWGLSVYEIRDATTIERLSEGLGV